MQTLQQRSKWRTQQPNLEQGELVLIKNDLLPPTKWSLGRILQCHPGKDNLVRVATVKTASSQFVRPIAKLVRLPLRE